MAARKKLTAIECQSIKTGETLYDSVEGLALIGTSGGAGNWRLRFTSPETGKRRDRGLGAFPSVSLAEARSRAGDHWALVQAGIDPIEDRERAAAKSRAASAAIARDERRADATLEKVAREFHRHHRAGLRNSKHAAQWMTSLEAHVFPTLGSKPIHAITADDLLEVLAPLADQVPETARRVRQRLDVVFADGMLNELCDRNPAAIVRRKLKRAKEERHLRALAYDEVPVFMAALRAFDRTSPSIRLAIEFLVLTAARSQEVRGMTWGELAGEVWTVPAERMKAGKTHRVPLPKRALTVLEEARRYSKGGAGDRVFPGRDGRSALSDMTLLTVLRRMPTGAARLDGEPEVYADRTTIHGFRSAFSTWAREKTRHRVDVIEAALAHREDDRVAAAYSRTSYEAERAKLAADWARFVDRAPAAVIEMSSAQR